MCVQAALELKAAHSVEVAACRQVVADQAHQIRRLKWQHGNANVAASQLSQAYQQQHLLKMQASKDQQSISALKREVRRSKWCLLAFYGNLDGSATRLKSCVSFFVEWEPSKDKCSMDFWSTTFLPCWDLSPLLCLQHTSIVSHACLLPVLLDTNRMFTAHKHCESYVVVACVACLAKHMSRVYSTRAL